MNDHVQKKGGDFLDRMVSMALGEYPVLVPRLASRYESVDGAPAERGFVELAMDVYSNPLEINDAPLHTVETDQKHPRINSPRSGAPSRVEPVERTDDLIAPMPRKSLNERDTERGGKPSPRVQTDTAPRQVERQDFEPREGGPESQQLLAAGFSRREPAFDRTLTQASVPGKDKAGAHRDAIQAPRSLEQSGQLMPQFLKILATPEPAEHSARPAEPVIHVSIGRVEIRATQAPNPSRAPKSAPKLMGLAEYLSKRGGRE